MAALGRGAFLSASPPSPRCPAPTLQRHCPPHLPGQLGQHGDCLRARVGHRHRRGCHPRAGAGAPSEGLPPLGGWVCSGASCCQGRHSELSDRGALGAQSCAAWAPVASRMCHERRAHQGRRRLLGPSTDQLPLHGPASRTPRRRCTRTCASGSRSTWAPTWPTSCASCTAARVRRRLSTLRACDRGTRAPTDDTQQGASPALYWIPSRAPAPPLAPCTRVAAGHPGRDRFASSRPRPPPFLPLRSERRQLRDAGQPGGCRRLPGGSQGGAGVPGHGQRGFGAAQGGCAAGIKYGSRAAVGPGLCRNLLMPSAPACLAPPAGWRCLPQGPLLHQHLQRPEQALLKRPASPAAPCSGAAGPPSSLRAAGPGSALRAHRRAPCPAARPP